MRVSAMLLMFAAMQVYPLLPEADDGWRYRLTPYAWFAGLKGNVGYQWNKAIGTAIGYRMFDVDYNDDGFFIWRQTAWGQLELTWAF